MIGRDAHSIRHPAQVVFEDFAMRRTSLDLMSAWSAIEIALWDIVAKNAGQPLYNILGGASRERVKVYANGWSSGTESIDKNLERALAVKARQVHPDAIQRTERGIELVEGQRNGPARR
jgi:galactonate dehydratase